MSSPNQAPDRENEGPTSPTLNVLIERCRHLPRQNNPLFRAFFDAGEANFADMMGMTIDEYLRSGTSSSSRVEPNSANGNRSIAGVRRTHLGAAGSTPSSDRRVDGSLRRSNDGTGEADDRRPLNNRGNSPGERPRPVQVATTPPERAERPGEAKVAGKESTGTPPRPLSEGSPTSTVNALSAGALSPPPPPPPPPVFELGPNPDGMGAQHRPSTPRPQERFHRRHLLVVGAAWGYQLPHPEPFTRLHSDSCTGGRARGRHCVCAGRYCRRSVAADGGASRPCHAATDNWRPTVESPPRRYDLRTYQRHAPPTCVCRTGGPFGNFERRTLIRRHERLPIHLGIIVV